MAHTNSTTNYGLPQWIGSDKPTFLGDFNSAFNTIDTQMKSNADTASGAAETASSANATAISANETAVAADGKATLAKNTADAATSAAQSASDLATVAKNTADSAAHASLANNIANLAPAYDETLTYSVGDLVSYVDENNTGKLYKCIVAWNTPGAFNINYWDDVTVSSLTGTHVKTVVTQVSGTKTNEFLKNTLYPVLSGLIGSVDNVKMVTLKLVEPNDTFIYTLQDERHDGLSHAYIFKNVFKTVSDNKEATYIFTYQIADALASCKITSIRVATSQNVAYYTDPGDGSTLMDNQPALRYNIYNYTILDFDRDFVIDVYR